MALPEQLLWVIAKNQLTKDPYEADMLQLCLSAVASYYYNKGDNKLDETIEIINTSLSENTLINAVQLDKLNSDIIALLNPKHLLETKIRVLGKGKISNDEEEKAELRKLYKLIEEKLENYE